MFDFGPFAIGPAILLGALVLDCLIGDPAWLPHPVRWIGGIIQFVDDNRSRVPLSDRSSGFLLAILLPVLVGTVVFLVLSVALDYARGTYPILSVFFLWSTLSARGLFLAGRNVLEQLRSGTLDEARLAVSRMVGRRTENLSEGEISRAGIESLAEGFLDGVLSPLFWVLVGGIPGVMLYKTVNTLDSMVGYRSLQYRDFGCVSARLDDAMNWIPARLSVLFVTLAAWFSGDSLIRTWDIALADRYSHPSPNAGHPESAFAGALECRLGGKTDYEGYNEEKSYLNEDAAPAGMCDLKQSLQLYGTVAALTGISFVLVSFL
jgi:adenosylcobinamide-phosphate synthase